MPFLFVYMLKLSVSLAVVFLFYHFVLRKLTFYNWNRWYLLGYTLLSFVIPFINITPALHKNELTDATVVQWIPVLYKSTDDTLLTGWNILYLLIIAGMLVLLTRLIVQYISFRRMRRKATFISDEGIHLYQVDESIIPFSFGNAVFINRQLHTAEELEEIIRHEFVHVKQRHSIDVIFGEMLCLFNWFNPFAWLLRRSIRQNLEFIADSKVIENGFNKKQYQYLLLKVIGNNQFSIAPKFNFSSLKKRIAMMNKNKSAKLHLLRFLFLLPVLAFILVSFRKEIGDSITVKQKQLHVIPASTTDTIPDVTEQNNKGYIINVKDKKGECLLVIKDKKGKEVKRMLLTEWNENAEKYEALYGEIPPPPPPTPQYLDGTVSKEVFLKSNSDVKEVGWVFHHNNTIAILHLTKKDGSVENYNLDNKEDREAAEKRYGKFPYPPPQASAPPKAPVSPTEALAPIAPIAPIAPVSATAPIPPVPPTAPIKNEQLNSVVVELKKNEQVVDVSIKGPGNSSSIYLKGNIEIKDDGPDNVLYIVDGVIESKKVLNTLDPKSIESINVLKGQSATALYGEKGKNGVIIITTKNASNVKAKAAQIL